MTEIAAPPGSAQPGLAQDLSGAMASVDLSLPLRSVVFGLKHWHGLG